MSGQGAYIQLIGRDVQDTMTTIQPQMTFFKSVFRSYTNFAREVHEMSIYGDADYGKLFSARVDRYGDLLGDTYLRIRTTHLNDQGITNYPQTGSIAFADLKTVSINPAQITQIDNDFTAELWFYLVSLPDPMVTGEAFLFLNRKAQGLFSFDLFGASVVSPGNLRVYVIGSIYNYAASLTTSTWYHIAIVRENNNVRIYINGISGGTASNANSIEPGEEFTIGNYLPNDPNYGLDGKITNFRIVNGTAVYTSNFIPPTEPLSLIPGTELLLLASTPTTVTYDTSGYSTPTDDGISWSSLTPFNVLTFHNVLCRFALQLLDYIEIKIGETIIDRHYGKWMDIWSQLVMPLSQYRVYDNMVSGRYWQNETLPISGYSGSSIFYIPLMFWYTHHPGLFLPLIALQYHEVFFNIKFKSRNEIKVSPDDTTIANLLIPDIIDVSVLGNYYLLDTYERRQFSLMPKMEYLIFSTQRMGTIDIVEGDTNIDISPFFHPIIDLVIACKEKSAMPFDYHQSSAPGTDTLKSILLQFNGNDRFKRRESTYFRCVQPYQFFPNAIGRQNQLDTSVPYVIDYPKGGFYVYSFALTPEKWWQPSGSANFSSMDKVTLDIKSQQVSDLELDIWVRNYNILLITGGMGGIVYANTFN